MTMSPATLLILPDNKAPEPNPGRSADQMARDHRRKPNTKPGHNICSHEAFSSVYRHTAWHQATPAPLELQQGHLPRKHVSSQHVKQLDQTGRVCGAWNPPPRLLSTRYWRRRLMRCVGLC